MHDEKCSAATPTDQAKQVINDCLFHTEHPVDMLESIRRSMVFMSMADYSDALEHIKKDREAYLYDFFMEAAQKLEQVINKISIN
jgi:hypothetical protein